MSDLHHGGNELHQSSTSLFGHSEDHSVVDQAWRQLLRVLSVYRPNEGERIG